MKHSLISCLLSVTMFGCADTNSGPTVQVETEASKTTPAVFNAAGAPTVMFSVPDMVCESCSAAVHDTLAAQEGAKEVTVDLEKKIATVAVDEEAFDEEAAIAALLDKQFSHAKLMAE